jgi:methyltransferase
MSYTVLQRVSELFISGRNEKLLRKNGAVEYGKSHYKYMVILHTLFLISVAAEYLINYSSRNVAEFNILLLFFFIVLQVFRFYTIYSLGKFWNTKILRIPGVPLVKKGIYKYVKHPNYFIVVMEIALIPLILNCYYTAGLFSILNLLMLSVRIKAENEALKL